MKRTQPTRFWGDARDKIETEAVCRLAFLGPCEGKLEAAHIVGRSHDEPLRYGEVISKTTLYVEPDRVFPACSAHHAAYDRHEIDALPALTSREQAQAVIDLGSIELAWQRTAPVAYRELYARRPTGGAPMLFNL